VEISLRRAASYRNTTKDDNNKNKKKVCKRPTEVPRLPRQGKKGKRRGGRGLTDVGDVEGESVEVACVLEVHIRDGKSPHSVGVLAHKVREVACLGLGLGDGVRQLVAEVGGGNVLCVVAPHSAVVDVLPLVADAVGEDDAGAFGGGEGQDQVPAVGVLDEGGERDVDATRDVAFEPAQIQSVLQRADVIRDGDKDNN